MMSGMPHETCSAFNKIWNNKFYYKVASCCLFLQINLCLEGIYIFLVILWTQRGLILLRSHLVYFEAFSGCFRRITKDSSLPVYSVSQPVFEPVAFGLKSRIVTVLEQSCFALNWCGALRKWPGNGPHYFLLCQRGQWFSNSHHCLVLSKPEGRVKQNKKWWYLEGWLVI
jgi:hypothetical protein